MDLTKFQLDVVKTQRALKAADADIASTARARRRSQIAGAVLAASVAAFGVAGCFGNRVLLLPAGVSLLATVYAGAKSEHQKVELKKLQQYRDLVKAQVLSAQQAYVGAVAQIKAQKGGLKPVIKKSKILDQQQRRAALEIDKALQNEAEIEKNNSDGWNNDLYRL